MNITSLFISNFKKILFILITGILIYSCGSNQISEKSSAELEQLTKIINEKGFDIYNDWAIPMGGNNISLISNPNFIKFKNDSVDIFLPYFGERYSGGAYGTSGGGIEYEGPAGNIAIEPKNNKILMKFNGKQGSEFLEFILTIFPDGTASTSVNSSERATISYRGEITSVKENKK